MTTPAQLLHVQDRATLALGMALSALFLSLAINVDEGQYKPLALFWLTLAVVVCLTAIIFRPAPSIEKFLREWITLILGGLVFIPICIMLFQNIKDPAICLPVLVLAALGFLQAVHLGAWKIPLLVLTVIGFCAVYTFTFASPQRVKDPHIDVFLFQQSAAEALRNGRNPYTTLIPNIYGNEKTPILQNPTRFGPGTGAYGPGVVDNNGWLTYGFPYPPMSLLMVMPGYLLGGDCRFAIVIAMGLSALLMATARPGPWGALMALLFLVNPKGFFVIDRSWTEPLLVFNFSVVMFCACRWRKGLPWALGFLFATKQYTAVLLPVLLLLVEGPNSFKQLLKMVTKAGLVVAVVTLPFIAWNPREFFRAVVQFQFVQPFRTDALSYLVWLNNHTGGFRAPIWTPFLVLIPVIIIAISRCEHSPAGFAAAATLISITFFAFNKQAFCNYYYFAIGTACWSVAAIWPQWNASGIATRDTLRATQN